MAIKRKSKHRRRKELTLGNNMRTQLNSSGKINSSSSAAKTHTHTNTKA
jgi:hypothetical protein